MERQLTIKFDAGYYDGDWLIDCNVTYPGIDGSDPITVKYDDLYDDDPEKTANRAAKDIAAWMQDPDGWIEEYIKHRSSNDYLMLEQARRDLERYQREAERYKDWAASKQKYAQQTEQEIAALEAKLA